MDNATTSLPSMTLTAEDYTALAADFARFHQSPLNVGLHLISSPLGLIAAVCLVNRLTRSPGLIEVLSLAYTLWLAPIVPFAVLLGTGALAFLIARVGRLWDISLMWSLAILFAAYWMQEGAHQLCGEQTFQAAYSNGGHIDFGDLDRWLSMVTEHVVYLLPLCVDVALPVEWKSASFIQTPSAVLVASHHLLLTVLAVFFIAGNYCLDSDSGFFPFSFSARRKLYVKLRDAVDLCNLAHIRGWAMAQKPPKRQTSHWWVKQLSPEAQRAFRDVAHSSSIIKAFQDKFNPTYYKVDVIDGMNEVYISAPVAKGTSDEVFYTEHVDGPLGLFPFCSAYRCIVGLDENRSYSTHFPMERDVHTVATGDVLAFDFHREPHFITRNVDGDKDASGDDFRVVLKIHYIAYPKAFSLLGKLLAAASTAYNVCFRALFLATIKPPSTPWEIFSGQVVVQTTRLCNAAQRVVGFQNILYVGLVALCAHAYDSYALFLVCTSFVHYLRYMTTYYVRENVAFEGFKRDVLLFKSLALAQLTYLYFTCFDFNRPDYISLGLIAVGYAISMLATRALGLDRTYFGVELGLVKPKWITTFPYGYIPHPMIVSQCLALAGFLKLAAFRASWGWLARGHIALYLLHMLQEHLDLHRTAVKKGASNSELAAFLFSMGGRTEGVLRGAAHNLKEE